MFNAVNKRRRDYIAMWFEVRGELGINDTMNIGPLDKRNGSINWFHFAHREMDGVGGVATVLRDHGHPCSDLPKGSEKHEPSFFKLLKNDGKKQKDTFPKSINWKENFPCSYDNSAPICTDYFDKDTTKLIKKNAKRNKVALSTYLFWSLNRAIADNLLVKNQHYYWFYPVNLRGAVDSEKDTNNLSSGLNIAVSNEMRPSMLQGAIKNKLKAKEHWMTWKLAHIGKYIGKSGVRFLYRSMSRKKNYAGSFSYLGSWPLKDCDNPPENPNEVWVSCGIGTKNYPVSTGVMEWHGQLSLGLKLHPWIANDQSITEKCLVDWKRYLLQELNHNEISG